MLDALQALKTEKCITTNAQKGKIQRIYVQMLFQHVKVGQMTSVYNQIMITWNNLDWQFGVYIS